MWCLSTEDVGVSWTEWHLTSSSSLSSSTRRHTISTRPPSDSSRVHPSRRANSRQDPPHCPDTARCRARSLQYRRRICCRPFCPRNCSTNITLTLSSRIMKLRWTTPIYRILDFLCLRSLCCTGGIVLPCPSRLLSRLLWRTKYISFASHRWNSQQVITIMNRLM